MTTHPSTDPHRPQRRSESNLPPAAWALFLLAALPMQAVAQANGVTPVCDRTPRVRDEIVTLVPEVSDCADVTAAHLAGIEEILNLRGPQDILSVPVNERETRPDIISELKAGDFSGLTSLREIDLARNNLTSLPEGIFSGLPALQQILLQYNRLTTLPEGAFSELSSLRVLLLYRNSIIDLPEGIFTGLSSLEAIHLAWNNLSALPAGTFSGLTSLQGVSVAQNRLTSLPEGIFSGLTSLQQLFLEYNELTNLPDRAFADLPALQGLYLDTNQLSSLPSGIFSGLSALELLRLDKNQLTALQEGLFSELSSLKGLYLGGNQMSSLPPGLFAGLSSLRELNLNANNLSRESFPDGIFSGLSVLKALRLYGNQLKSLPDGLFSGLVSLEWISLDGNPVDPLPVPVLLEWVEPGRFQARAPTGAPFDIELSILLTSGVIIEGGSRRLIIPRGATESPARSVSRARDAAAAVTADIQRLPTRPLPHYGYTLVRSPMPLTLWEPLALDFAHFANGSSITSELVIVNVGTEPIRPSFHFFDQEGDPIAAESVVDAGGNLEVRGDGALTIRTDVEPLGEVTISTHGRGELVTGSARVVADGPIGGVLRFDAPGIGVAGVGSSRPLRDAIFPVRRQEGAINTGAAIRYLGDGSIDVTCQLMQQGSVYEQVRLQFNANGQEARFIDEWFTETDTTDFTGSLRCRGNFTGVAFEMDAGNRIFTTLPVVNVPRGRPRDSVFLYFPHFANGSSITSDLVLVNTSYSPVRPVIHFYDQQGNLIDPESVVDLGENLQVRQDGGLIMRASVQGLGEVALSTHGRGELVTGSVRVVADGFIGGVLRFDVSSVGVAGVGAAESVRDAIFPVRRRAGGINTGAAIHNPALDPIQVDCQLMRDGTVLEEMEIPLPGNGQTAGFIDQWFTRTDTTDFTGTVRCTTPGDEKFTGVALEMDADNRIFTTLPVLPLRRPLSPFW